MTRKRNLPSGVYRSGKSSLRVVVNDTTYSNSWRQGVDEDLCGAFAKACREADAAGEPHPAAPPSGADTVTPPPTFRDYAKSWLDERRGTISGGRLVHLEGDLRNHVFDEFKRPEDLQLRGEPAERDFEPFADLPLAAIRRSDHIVPWVRHLVERRGLHRATVRKILWLVQSVFAHGQLSDETVVDPCRLVRIPEQTAPKRPPQYPEDALIQVLTPAALRRLADCMHPRLRASLWLTAFASLRMSEAHGLRLRDYDRKARTLSILRQAGRAFVQPDGSKAWAKPSTKTAAGRRILPLPETLAAFLDWYIDTYHEDPTVLNAPLCLPAEGKVPINGNFNRAFKKARLKAGLSREDLGWTVTPHSLRSMTNSILKQLGVDGAARSTWLGHKITSEGGESAATARYSRLVDGSLIALAETLDVWLQENVAEFLIPAVAFPDATPKGMLTAREAGELLGVGPATIHGYRKAGLLDGCEPVFHQTGKNYAAWWFRRADVLALPDVIAAAEAPGPGEITVEDIIKRLSRDQSTVYEWCRRKLFKARKSRQGRWLIDAESFEAWLRATGRIGDKRTSDEEG